MRHSPQFLGFLGIGLAIIVIASLVGAAAMSVTAPQSAGISAEFAANALQVAPILSEEVVVGKDSLSATLVHPNGDLTLLADDGAALANTHLARKAGSDSYGDLNAQLRSTESKFVGIGLEGSASVNGKPFSWANVNLSNISYG
jgi:hypothetical protein